MNPDQSDDKTNCLDGPTSSKRPHVPLQPQPMQKSTMRVKEPEFSKAFILNFTFNDEDHQS